jgi:hypothetical protein
MSLQDAIERNRTRQAAKRSGTPSERSQDGLQAFTINVLVIPPMVDVKLFGATVRKERRTIYGTSLADAKERAGIQ